MGRSIAKRLAAVLLSVGWVFPMWVAGATMLEYLEPDSQIISFPAVEFSYQALTVACVWLAAVLAYWVWRLTAAPGE